MEITEVRIKLMEDSDDRLQAFCSITFDDCFVVRDLKIIEGANGPFVAMPSRKLTFHCPQCGSKNHLRSLYCNQCGTRLKEDRLPRDADGRTKLYADIAHPINSACREMIQNRVIAEFNSELERAEQPGYVSRYDEDFLEEDDHDVEPAEEPGDQQTEATSDVKPAAGSRESESGQESRRVTRTEVQPAEREPRPPHHVPSRTAPAERSAPATPPRDRAQDERQDDFGAGIFDD